MIDKILMKSEDEVIVYFSNRSPVTISSDCGKVLELVHVILGPWNREETHVYKEERRKALRPWSPSMDEDTVEIELSDDIKEIA